MGSRFTALVVGVFLTYAYIVFNLYELQLQNGSYYIARAGSQYSLAGLLSAPRGAIYFTDKNNNHLPVVLNKNFPVIYAVPKVVANPTAAAGALSSLLTIPAVDLEKRLSKNTSAYDPLVKKADPALARRVEDMNIKGIYLDSAPGRYYPLNSLASQVLGFVAPDANGGEQGRYGLEEFYNSVLAGQNGQVEDGKIMPPRSGQDIYLTLDPNIQIEAERILADLVKTHQAVGGSVIVEDPHSGKILAMDSVPHFDPNNYNRAALEDFLNPTTQKIYEPGSVLKVLTMAAGIDAGKITPETTFKDTGVLVLNGRTIRNWDLKAHGLVTMTNVIEHSLNTGAAFAERQTGDETFKQYILNFGFNEKTGVDLPAELPGNFRSLLSKNAQPVTFATASFGQGVAATPLQIINAVGAIANGGILYQPYLNANLKPKVIRRVISPDTAAKVTGMMVSAVDKAIIAQINGYAIAGKTGTAQVPDFQNGGYTDKVINTYIGFGPATRPRFIILIKLNQPEGAPLAGLTVVPAFRNLAQFILNYYNISPDRLEPASSISPAISQ